MPRSRVCACLDSGVGKHGENARIERCASLPNSLQSFRAACSREPSSISILANIQPEWNADVILPPNKLLLSPTLDEQSVEAERLLARWGRLHAVRSVLSGFALRLFLYLAVFAKSGNRG
jgi:hypothetical protein